MTQESGEVRPRHVLSVIAAGTISGGLAEFLALVTLIGVAVVQGIPIPPPAIESAQGAVASVIGASLAGLLYVFVLPWLPASLLARSALSVLLGTPTIAGVHLVGLVAGDASLARTIPWSVGLALITAGLIPAMVRATIWGLVQSPQLAGLPLVTSLVLIGLVLVVPAMDVSATGRVLSAAWLGLLVLAGLIAVLVWVGLTTGLRPANERPRWWHVVGWGAGVLAVVTGVAMVNQVLAR